MYEYIRLRLEGEKQLFTFFTLKKSIAGFVVFLLIWLQPCFIHPSSRHNTVPAHLQQPFSSSSKKSPGHLLNNPLSSYLNDYFNNDFGVGATIFGLTSLENNIICPNPFNPVDAILTSNSGFLSSHGQEKKCINVPSNSTEWEITLCYSTTSCSQGFVVVEYLDKERCDIVESSYSPDPDPAQNSYIKSRLGPHTLAVIFDGSRRVSYERPVHYDGGCKYKYNFNLNNGGDWIMRVILVYEDYLALNSTKIYPIPIDQKLLSKPFKSPIDACHSSCRRYEAQDVPKDRKRCDKNDKTITGTWLPNFKRLSSIYDPLPLSPPPSKISSRYMKVSERDSVPLDEFATHEIGINPIEWNKFPPYTWISNNCALEDTAVTHSEKESLEIERERAICFGHRSAILFTGDSHSRAMFDIISRRMATSYYRSNAEKVNFNTASWDRDTVTLGGVTLDFKFDPVQGDFRFKKPADSMYSNYTHVVMGAAQWCTDQSMKLYSTHIDEIISVIANPNSTTKFIWQEANPNSTTKFIWQESPSMPHTYSEKKKKEKDMITNARMSAFNDYARAQFARAGFPVLPFFDISLPFDQEHESKDLMHWFDSPVLDAFLQVTVHHLGLCSV